MVDASKFHLHCLSLKGYPGHIIEHLSLDLLYILSYLKMTPAGRRNCSIESVDSFMIWATLNFTNYVPIRLMFECHSKSTELEL